MEVFPTQVGMFLEERVSLDAAFLLSLRRWGCFPDRVLLRHDGGVFPTQVGMFLKVKEEIVASNCYAIARVLHDIAQVFTTN